MAAGLVDVFQFLMVRLKVNNKIKARLELNKFQFLMVRLKETIVVKNTPNNNDFNSLWCD